MSSSSSSSSSPRKGRSIELEGAEVTYFPGVFSPAEAAQLFREIDANPSWRSRRVKLFDKRTRRRFSAPEGRPTMSFSIPPGKAYTYSGSKRIGEPFPRNVLEAKRLVEDLLAPELRAWAASSGLAREFNFCLANKYEHGGHAVGRHADDERDIVPRSPIAALSLGEPRVFRLEAKHDLKKSVDVLLEPGSVLLMAGRTQERVFHSILKDRDVNRSRISLTFRMNI